MLLHGVLCIVKVKLRRGRVSYGCGFFSALESLLCRLRVSHRHILSGRGLGWTQILLVGVDQSFGRLGRLLVTLRFFEVNAVRHERLRFRERINENLGSSALNNPVIFFSRLCVEFIIRNLSLLVLRRLVEV